MDEQKELISWKFGMYYGGWADLIEDKGELAEAVSSDLIKILNERKMPDVQIGNRITVRAGYFDDERRTLTITKTYPGVSTLVNITQHGKDLFTSWNCYYQPQLNWKLIGVYAAISISLVMIWGILLTIWGIINITKRFFYSGLGDSLMKDIGNLLLYGAGIFIIEVILLAIISRMVSRNFRTYFSDNSKSVMAVLALLGAFAVNGIGSKIFSGVGEVHSYYSMGLQGFGVPGAFFIPAMLGNFTVILFLAGFAGGAMRGNLFSFILKEPNVFDLDDITAMNYSIHKSILRALDNHQIDTSKLRSISEPRGRGRNEKR